MRIPFPSLRQQHTSHPHLTGSLQREQVRATRQVAGVEHDLMHAGANGGVDEGLYGAPQQVVDDQPDNSGFGDAKSDRGGWIKRVRVHAVDYDAF